MRRRLELWIKAERAVLEAQAANGGATAIGAIIAGGCALFAFAALGAALGALLHPHVGLAGALGLVGLVYLIIGGIAFKAANGARDGQVAEAKKLRALARQMVAEDSDVLITLSELGLQVARRAARGANATTAESSTAVSSAEEPASTPAEALADNKASEDV